MNHEKKITGIRLTLILCLAKCQERYYASSNISSFTSPNFPNDYPPYTHCSYEIIDSSPSSSKQLTLQFSDFNVESTRNCYYDYVALYIDDTPRVYKLCGREPKGKIWHAKQKIKLLFATDKETQFQGFRALYWKRKYLIDYMEGSFRSLSYHIFSQEKMPKSLKIFSNFF